MEAKLAKQALAEHLCLLLLLSRRRSLARLKLVYSRRDWDAIIQSGVGIADPEHPEKVNRFRLPGITTSDPVAV